jgi:hypothetical protein
MPTSYPNNRMKTMMLLTYMNALLKKHGPCLGMSIALTMVMEHTQSGMSLGPKIIRA